MSRLHCIAAAAILTGCAEPAAEHATAPGRAVHVTEDPCEEEWRCGGNSPVVSVHEFHELELHGVENAQHLALDSTDGHARIWIGGVPYFLELDGRNLTARNSAGTLTGPDLVGGTIVIRDKGVPAHRLVITATRDLPLPFPIGTAETTPVYVLEWGKAAGGPTQNLCANPPFHLLSAPSEIAYSELLGLNPDEAVVFGFDRFDTDAMEMNAVRDPNWITIGCAGHTLAKMYLTRHSIIDEKPKAKSQLARRQATLKLLTADYCGTGRKFTIPGQPLQWKGKAGEPRDAYFSAIPIESLEARWGAHGAVCLNEPRMALSELPDAQKHYPDIWGQIALECELPPPCTNVDPDDLDGALRIAANPVP